MFHLGTQNEHVHVSVCFPLPKLYLSGGQVFSVALSQAAPARNEDFQNGPDSGVKYLYLVFFHGFLFT